MDTLEDRVNARIAALADTIKDMSRPALTDIQMRVVTDAVYRACCHHFDDEDCGSCDSTCAAAIAEEVRDILVDIRRQCESALPTLATLADLQDGRD